MKPDHTLFATLSLLTSAALIACSDGEAPRRFVSDAGSDAVADDDAINPLTPTSNPSSPSAPNTSTSSTTTSAATTPRITPPTASTPATAVPTNAGGSGGAPGGDGDSAGAGGTAGATSAGAGAGATVDAGPEVVPEPLVFDDYGVVCEDRNAGATSSAQFSVGLWLVNNTTERIPLEEISVRYYFTSDNEFEPMLQGHRVFIDDASPAYGLRENVLSNVFALEPAEDLADHYVELSFGPGDCGGVACVFAPTPEGLEPVLDHRPIQLRVQIDPAALRYTLTNDYSYNPDADGQVLCENITLYRNGRLIFGVEPDGTVPMPVTDGGVPSDGGMSPADSGLPSADAGLPSSDAGTADAGGGDDDAGTDPLDAGVETVDGGGADASAPDGSVPADAGVP